MPTQVPSITVIAHNLRSVYNVGSILRTCDGLGVKRFIATGTTPSTVMRPDTLPHVTARLSKQIAKTSLGAEKNLDISHMNIDTAIEKMNSENVEIYALEQSANSKTITEFKPKAPFALIVGNETQGLPQNILDTSDSVIEIPMKGKKESFNVAVATAIALWELTN